jgi:hypothetical protein
MKRRRIRSESDPFSFRDDRSSVIPLLFLAFITSQIGLEPFIHALGVMLGIETQQLPLPGLGGDVEKETSFFRDPATVNMLDAIILMDVGTRF